MCTFVPILSSLSTGSSTKSSRQELLARTPLHRLIITKGLRSYDAYPRIILSVMIAPSEPSISLRSWLANNSKGRCSWKLFEILRFIINGIIVVSELSNLYKVNAVSNKLQQITKQCTARYDPHSV
jgi:hypothetical protein